MMSLLRSSSWFAFRSYRDAAPLGLTEGHCQRERQTFWEMAFCVASGRRSFAAKEHKEHKEKKLQSLWVLCVLLRLIFVAASAPRERIVAVLTSRTHIL